MVTNFGMLHHDMYTKYLSRRGTSNIDTSRKALRCGAIAVTRNPGTRWMMLANYYVWS